LLDVLKGCAEDDVIPPGGEVSVELRGLATEDDDEATSISVEVFAEALEQPRIRLKLGTVAPAFGESTSYEISLTRADGTPVLGGRTLKLYWSVDGKEWQYKPTWTDDGSVSGIVKPLQKVYYRAVFWGDSEYAMAQTEPVVVQPKTEVTAPSLPEVVSEDVLIRGGGLVKPDHAAGSRDVQLRCYRYESGTWVLRKTVWTFAFAYPGAYARYSAGFALPSKGRWKVIAYHPADKQTRADMSASEFVTVR